MAFSFYVNGVDLASRIQTESGVQTLTTLADHGEVGGSGIEFDDPDGDLEILGWQRAYANESDCSQQRIWTGYMLGRDISRGIGSNRTAASRQHTATLLDLNSQLGRKLLLYENANKRPYESETDRMTWLLGTRALDGIVYDEGLVDTSGGQSFDEADFRDQYAGEVFASMASTGNNFFVYRDHASGHDALFWDSIDATTNTCTLSISNDRADIDGDLVWYPYRDAVLTRDPSEVYSGVEMSFQSEQHIYRSNSTTADTYISRDYLYQTSRIGRLATAEDVAAAFLTDHGHEFDTIRCTVLLPSSRVGLIEAGMRIQVKFTHLPGYEDFTYLRIVGVDLKFALGGNTLWYAMTLDLTNRIHARDAGGGGGSGVPLPPTTGDCVPDYTVDKMLAATITASGSPLPSNPSYANDGNASTFTTINPGVSGAGTHDSYWDCDMGSAMILSHFEVDRTPPGSGTPIVETPGTGGTVTWRLWFSDDGSSWTEDTAYTYTTIPVAPSGTYAVISTSETTAHRYWRWHREYVLTGLQFIKQHSVYRFSFYECVAPDPEVPPPGTFTQWLKVADGDGSTTTYTFPFPFTDYSLEVRYDTVDQTNAIVSFDGTTGDFTMQGPALTGQQVFARAQGR